MRSYRTFSPLPCAPCGAWAVSSLWHLPSLSLNAQVPDVIRHTALWSPDFPLPSCPCSGRPACLLLYDIANWTARFVDSPEPEAAGIRGSDYELGLVSRLEGDLAEVFRICVAHEGVPAETVGFAVAVRFGIRDDSEDVVQGNAVQLGEIGGDPVVGDGAVARAPIKYTDDDQIRMRGDGGGSLLVCAQLASPDPTGGRLIEIHRMG